MDAKVMEPEERARLQQQQAAQFMLQVVAGMTGREAMTSVVLAMATLCAGIAQDAGGTADGAADLARRMVGQAEREARRQFGRVKAAPAGRC